MITYTTGNILEADAEALVNTVNTVGVMGKGVALQFKRAFPDNFRLYAKACREGAVRPGEMLVFPTGELAGPKFIINFPTKMHWRGPSRLEYVDSGLQDLRRVVKSLSIRSLAVPPLGCGSGGLSWDDVRKKIEQYLAHLPNVDVLVFSPQSAPVAAETRLARDRDPLTRARAMLILLLESYSVPGYRSGLLETQKLAYFLQRAGEDLRLKFVKQQYGPYAENLNHVLQRLEGQYITGYGDRTGRASMAIVPGAAGEATTALRGEPEAEKRLRRVNRLIQGFETPYGMELLASVDWVAQGDQRASFDPEAAIVAVHAWSARKRNKFQPEHIHRAWQRLRDEGWLRPATSLIGPLAKRSRPDKDA